MLTVSVFAFPQWCAFVSSLNLLIKSQKAWANIHFSTFYEAISSQTWFLNLNSRREEVMEIKKKTEKWTTTAQVKVRCTLFFTDLAGVAVCTWVISGQRMWEDWTLSNCGWLKRGLRLRPSSKCCLCQFAEPLWSPGRTLDKPSHYTAASPAAQIMITPSRDTYVAFNRTATSSTLQHLTVVISNKCLWQRAFALFLV